MTAQWPPPRARDDRTAVVTVNGDDRRGHKVEGRVVRLWGRDVVIDDEGDVFCDYCKTFVPVAVLGSPRNKHGVGRRPVDGATTPIHDQGDRGERAARAQPWHGDAPDRPWFGR